MGSSPPSRLQELHHALPTTANFVMKEETIDHAYNLFRAWDFMGGNEPQQLMEVTIDLKTLVMEVNDLRCTEAPIDAQIRSFLGFLLRKKTIWDK